MPTGYMRVNLNGQKGTPGAAPLPTAVEKDLLFYLNGIPGAIWFDGKYSTVDASGFVSSLPSWLSGADSQQQKALQTDADNRPALNPTTDGQKGWQGRRVGAADRGWLLGTPNAQIPAPPFQVLWFGAVSTAGDPGVLFATDGPADQVVVDVTTDSRYRFYTSFSGGQRLQTGPSVVLPDPCAMHFQAAGGNGAISRNGASLVSGALGANVAGRIRIGSMNNAGTDPFNVPNGYGEFLILVPNTDAAFKTKTSALVQERHPGIIMGGYA
jgi:hypothetical protein